MTTIMPDNEEIIALQRGYAEAFDARNAEAFAALFTQDAVLVDPTGRAIVGRAKLEKVVRNSPPGGTHIPGETQIEIAGDSATATSCYRAILPTGQQVAGSYKDVYSRTNEGWRIARREVLAD